jgi:hypothetical protein
MRENDSHAQQANPFALVNASDHQARKKLIAGKITALSVWLCG